jgi:hypothetical protein
MSRLTRHRSGVTYVVNLDTLSSTHLFIVRNTDMVDAVRGLLAAFLFLINYFR